MVDLGEEGGGGRGRKGGRWGPFFGGGYMRDGEGGVVRSCKERSFGEDEGRALDWAPNCACERVR